jgi:hypothetical protein
LLFNTAFKERMSTHGQIDILWLYQDYCVTSKDTEIKGYIIKYLEEQYTRWKK